MKKRIFSLVLALMLALSLLPMAALAASGEASDIEENEEVAVEPTEASEEPVALEGASGEVTEVDSSTTDEPSVQSVSETEIPQEGGASGLPAIPYVDPTNENPNQECSSYTAVTSATNTWGEDGKDTWYVVNENATINNVVTVKGNVHLILCDGKKLEINGGAYGIDGTGSLTIYGQSGTGELEATGSSGVATSYGIRVGSLTVNGGVVTATGGSATEANGSAYSYGIYVCENGALTITGGTVTATGGTAKAFYAAGSYGIYMNDNTNLNITGGTVRATGSTATAEHDGSTYYAVNAISYGISAIGYSTGFNITNSTVTATGNAATAKFFAGSCGISASGYGTGLNITNSTVTTTGGEATGNSANSYGIYAYANLTVTNSTVTATGGAAEEDFDIYIFVLGGSLQLSGGEVKSARADGAVRVSARIKVSNGAMKLTEGSLLYSAEVSEGVALGDLLADGCAYWKTVWLDWKETESGIMELEGLTQLAYDLNLNSGSGCLYYVKPCTHSTTDSVCAYCGKDFTPTPTPVPTATPAPKAPNTGDEANVVLWLVLATVSVFGVAVMGRKKVR